MGDGVKVLRADSDPDHGVVAAPSDSALQRVIREMTHAVVLAGIVARYECH